MTPDPFTIPTPGDPLPRLVVTDRFHGTEQTIVVRSLVQAAQTILRRRYSRTWHDAGTLWGRDAFGSRPLAWGSVHEPAAAIAMRFLEAEQANGSLTVEPEQDWRARTGRSLSC